MCGHAVTALDIGCGPNDGISGVTAVMPAPHLARIRLAAKDGEETCTSLGGWAAKQPMGRLVAGCASTAVPLWMAQQHFATKKGVIIKMLLSQTSEGLSNSKKGAAGLIGEHEIHTELAECT